MFIIDDTIFSYGRHFPMARHINGVILFTTDTYSNTTAKQLSQLRNAIYQTVYNVPDVLAHDHSAHLANFEDYRERFNALLEKASKARNNKEWLLDQASTLAAQANSYAYNFDVKHAPINTDNIDLDNIKEVVKARKAEEKAKAEKAEKKRQREQAKQIKAWQNCEPNTRAPSTKKTYLRLVGDSIQTSKAASIPVNDARLLWDMVTTCRNEKQSFKPSEQLSVGHYSLTGIDSKGNIKVNCHYIEYDQLKRMAKILNYI